MATHPPEPRGWTPNGTYTGRRDQPPVWGPCTTCGQRCQLRPAMNGEGLTPVACRRCNANARRP